MPRNIRKFLGNVLADGGTVDYPALASEYNSLHSIIKSKARYLLIAGAYKANTIYAVDIVTGNTVKFSFTRAGTATYYDKNGIMQIAAPGQARVDYHPRTLALRGYLIENSTTNYDNNSNSFPSSTYWTNVIPGAAIYKGLSYTQGANTDIGQPLKTTNAVAAIPGGITLSIHIKILSGNDLFGWRILRPGGNGTVRMVVSTGTISFDSTTGLSPTVISLDLGNGYYRISLMVPGWTDGGSVAFGYGGGTMLLAAHQIEGNPIATSYIPTSGSQVTRVADSGLTCESDLLNDTAATAYMQMSVNRNGITYNLIRNASSDGAMWYESAINTQNALARDGTNSVNRSSSVTDGQSNKVVTSYGTNGLLMAANGSAITNSPYDGTFGVSAVTKIFYSPATGVVRCHVKAVAIFTSQISDADMITISTP